MPSSRYCVIGGAGFIGSHVVDKLIEKGNEVLVLDNLISGHKKNVNSRAKFQWFDIRDDEHALAGIFKKHGIQFVMNYAAEPYVPESFDRPKYFFIVNAVSVINVLEACQAANVERILQVSSAEIYGDFKGKATEDTRIIPHSTYGVSKVAADGICQVRWREAGVPVIALRQFNCIGPRETHEYVVPEIIFQLSKGNQVRLGNNTFRDFQYVGDAAEMAIELLHEGKFGEVYNMGSQEGIKIYDLAHKIGKLMGHQSVEIIPEAKRMRPWDIEHLQSDNSKIFEVIRYRPKTTLEQALGNTIDYFRGNGSKWDWSSYEPS